MKVILMHGKSASPESKWYPWFKRACEAHGWECVVPKLPKSDNPVLSEWVAELANLEPDQETVLVGHSRGGVAVMRYLEAAPEALQIKAVVLLAANSSQRNKMPLPSESNFGFYTDKEYNFEAIRTHSSNFYVLHSTDDHAVPYQAGEENAVGLGVELMTFKGRRHFGTQADGTQ